jgi:hypothetical protein
MGTPGKGGWPTLRHYNSETGLEGVQYNQKTSKAVCDEMKEDNYMETYVMEAGETSRCQIADGTNCTDKEKEYVAKYHEQGAAATSSQYERLVEMSKKEGAKQSVSGFKWLAQRKAILRKLLSENKADEL